MHMDMCNMLRIYGRRSCKNVAYVHVYMYIYVYVYVYAQLPNRMSTVSPSFSPCRRTSILAQLSIEALHNPFFLHSWTVFVESR